MGLMHTIFGSDWKRHLSVMKGSDCGDSLKVDLVDGETFNAEIVRDYDGDCVHIAAPDATYRLSVCDRPELERAIIAPIEAGATWTLATVKHIERV